MSAMGRAQAPGDGQKQPLMVTKKLRIRAPLTRASDSPTLKLAGMRPSCFGPA